MIAIGIVVLVMLSIPLFLYPLVPEDTLKAGHVVFAAGKQRVPLQRPGKYQQYGFRDTCLLEANAALMVTEPGQPGPGEVLVVQPLDETRGVEPPFCPPQAKVLVERRHLIVKPSLSSRVEAFLSNVTRP